MRLDSRRAKHGFSGKWQAGSHGMLKDKRAQDSWSARDKLIKARVWLMKWPGTAASYPAWARSFWGSQNTNYGMHWNRLPREAERCPSLECQNPTGQHLEQHNLTLIRSRSLVQNIFLSLHSTVPNQHCRTTHSNLNASITFKLIKICSCSTYFIHFWTRKQARSGKYSCHYHGKTRKHSYKFFNWGRELRECYELPITSVCIYMEMLQVLATYILFHEEMVEIPTPLIQHFSLYIFRCF